MDSKCARYPVFSDYETHMTFLVTGRYPDTGYDFVSCKQARRDATLCGKDGRDFKFDRQQKRE